MAQPISRREFLKYSAAAIAVAAVGSVALTRPEPALAPAQAPLVAPAEEKVVPTVCGLCPSGCGLNVRVVNAKAVKIEGNPLHPLNQGVCCPKGQAALEVLYSPERLSQPLHRANRASREWTQVSWEQALDLAAGKLRDLRERSQAHTVAVLYGETRGQMRDLIRRFLAAYGSPNAMDVQDPDAQAARLAMFLMQGINGVPVYHWESARYVLAFGGGFLETGRHLLPALSGSGFMRRSSTSRGKIVAIDPRLSIGAAKADEWIPIRPGTLGALALGVAHVLIRSDLYDQKFVQDFAFGFGDFTDDAGVKHRGFASLVLEEYTLDRVEAITGVPSGTIARLAGEFAGSRPAVALLPTGRAALASGNALSTARAIYALNALVGNIDAAGGVLVQRFPKLADWPAFTLDTAARQGAAMERVDGAGTREYPFASSLYPALAQRIAAGKPYPVNALVLCNTNPVFEQKGFGDALAQVPFVVSLAPTLDASAAQADLVLPVSTFLESWSDSFVEGTGYAGLALGQPVVPPIHDTRGLGDVLLALARKIGGAVAEALPFADYQALVRHRVTGSEIAWDNLVEKGAWSQMIYFHAAPGSKVWNEQVVGRERVNAPKDGRLDFYSREMFYALKQAGLEPTDRDCLPHFDQPIETAKTSDFPFQLVLQETMTQPRGWSGIVPSLQETYGLQQQARWDSWVELNPQAAAALGVRDGDWVWIESARGKVKARARLYPGLWPNAISMPLGQGHATRVAWDRDSAGEQTVGVNPLDLVGSRMEKWSGVAALAPTRVKVYRA